MVHPDLAELLYIRYLFRFPSLMSKIPIFSGVKVPKGRMRLPHWAFSTISGQLPFVVFGKIDTSLSGSSLFFYNINVYPQSQLTLQILGYTVFI